MDQNKVIERIKSGGEEELENIYRKHRKEFINWISKNYNCSLEDSKDIYQSTIISFYESIKTGKLVELNSSLKTYLFAIGKNKVHEQKRHLIRQEEILQNIDNGRIYEVDEDEEKPEHIFKKIEKSLEKLGDPCKTLLIFYYYHKLSIQELTERLNYKNPDTSKNLKYKCLKRLRRIYENQLENLK